MVPPEFENTHSFLLAYRYHHLPAKRAAFRTMARLVTAIDQENLFLSDSDQPGKQLLLNVLALEIIGNGFSILEDFLRLANATALSDDLRDLPALTLAFRSSPELRGVAKDLARSDEKARRALWYMSEDEINQLTNLSKDEKSFIVDLLKENVRHFKSVCEVFVKLSETYMDAYNKYKHGYPFLFALGSSLAGSPLEPLGVAIPYFSNSRSLQDVSAIPVGTGALRIVKKIIDGGGGLTTLPEDLINNASLGCKLGGLRILPGQAYGPNALNIEVLAKGDRLLKRYLEANNITWEPEERKLTVKSTMSLKDFNWMLSL